MEHVLASPKLGSRVVALCYTYYGRLAGLFLNGCHTSIVCSQQVTSCSILFLHVIENDASILFLPAAAFCSYIRQRTMLPDFHFESAELLMWSMTEVVCCMLLSVTENNFVTAVTDWVAGFSWATEVILRDALLLHLMDPRYRCPKSVFLEVSLYWCPECHRAALRLAGRVYVLAHRAFLNPTLPW